MARPRIEGQGGAPGAGSARAPRPQGGRPPQASMNLNADLGEGAGEDEAILGFVDSANVACGAHAGSISTAIATALRCRQLGVEVGAHPGYDDHARFGRVEIALSPAEIEALVAYQVAGLAAVVPIAYVKA